MKTGNQPHPQHPTVALCVPTYNPGASFRGWLEAIETQSLQPNTKIIIDSSSNEGWIDFAINNNYLVKTIPKNEFGHGKTRNLCLDIASGHDIIIFMTQDAILANEHSLTNLIHPLLEDVRILATYGRQLPHAHAQCLGSHARLFNYPQASYVRSFSDRNKYGIKTSFFSNSFAAYSLAALQAVGGFPQDIILGEDVVAVAKILQAGGSIAYSADATVYHSHDYSITEEFKRYFDIGVFHNQERWILDAFGKPEGEGIRFIRSEVNYVLKRCPILMMNALMRHLSKYIGYKLGQNHRKLPATIALQLSMNPQALARRNF